MGEDDLTSSLEMISTSIAANSCETLALTFEEEEDGIRVVSVVYF